METNKERMRRMIDEMIEENELRLQRKRNGLVAEVEKVVGSLVGGKGSVSVEDVLYRPEEYGFDDDTLSIVYDYFNEYAEEFGKISYNEYEDFYNQSFWFEYGGHYVEVAVTYGQGTDVTFFHVDSLKEHQDNLLIRFEDVVDYWESK